MPDARLKLTLAYVGIGFRGWAPQPGLRTVEGEVRSIGNPVLDNVWGQRGQCAEALVSRYNGPLSAEQWKNDPLASRTGPRGAQGDGVVELADRANVRVGRPHLSRARAGGDDDRVPRHAFAALQLDRDRFGIDRPVAYGQVYATLSRLLKNGFVTVDGVQAGGGPERKRYAITPDGVADVETWLGQPEKPDLYLHSTLYAKVVLALRSGRAADEILDTQRAEHLRLMRELTQRKMAGNLADQLVCDHALFHLEADLRWIDLTSARLGPLAEEVRAR